MIVEYHRPETLKQALELLARTQPRTLPMGGGTVLSRSQLVQDSDIAVVDLQSVGLNTMEHEGQLLGIGATVTLQQMMEYDGWPEGLRGALLDSLEKEMSLNLRNTATLGGTLVSSDGRSPLVTTLLALDPRVEWTAIAAPAASGLDGVESTPLGDFLLLRREFTAGRLITGLRLPLNQTLRFAQVARSPLDRPVVCAAVARWPSGRTRVTLGGYGDAPVLAMDGPEPAGAMASAREAYRAAGDPWASAEYRMDVAGKLVKRLALEVAGATVEVEE